LAPSLHDGSVSLEVEEVSKVRGAKFEN